MHKININRRKILKLGLAVGGLAFLPTGCLELSTDKMGKLLKFVSKSNLPVNEKKTGVLNDKEFNVLSSLCEYVNKVWELTPDLDQYLKVLRSDLDLKTDEEPSYLTEYRNAIGLIDAVMDNEEDSDKGWTMLLFSDFDNEDFDNTELGRARRLVFSEIITHFVSTSGGFKSFGLWNYRGYFGGTYTSPESYRKTEVL